MALKCKIILITYLLSIMAFAKCHDLKQVLILSRHNIRAPLSSNLNHLSNNSWPAWDVESGILTAKGAVLESYIGNHISNWMVKKGLLSTGCPEQSSIYVYANTRQRTKATAKAFVDGAFKNCNITVYSKNTSNMDPIFNPILHNALIDLKSIIVKTMQQKLDNLKFKNAYSKLNDIVNLKEADVCKIDNVCDFTKAKDSIVYEVGKEPDIKGPLALTNSIVDAFLMSYYEGMEINNVAWGKIKSPEDWHLFTRITQGNLDVRFNCTLLSKDVAKPLINYIYNILIKENSPKFTLLVGHDSNLKSVMTAIDFKPYILPGQYELIPIGGKIIFQKWHDNENNKDLLKVEYIYQTVSQLRNGDILSDSNPPHRITLEINNCNIDADGYCQWDDFMSILKSNII